MKTLANAVLLTALLSGAAYAQVNEGLSKANMNPPFTLTPVTTFDYPWRLAFLPDGRMLVTEKVGRVDLVTQDGKKTVLRGTPSVYYQGQNGMLGVFLSPHFATDNMVYLTYVEKYVLEVYCIYCVISAAVITLITALSIGWLIAATRRKIA